jgi:hypothetical protein
MKSRQRPAFLDPLPLPRLVLPPLALPRLALPLLAAVLAHGLWLSYAQLRRSRQPPPPALSARDDTPELLRFSRRMPLEQSFSTVPLPPASTLPPPPPDLLAPLPRTAAGAPANGAPASRSPVKGTAAPSRPKTRLAMAAGTRPGAAALRPASGPADRQPPAPAAGGATAGTAPGGEPSAELGSGPAGEGLLATLRTVRRLAGSPAAEDREARVGPPGDAALLLRPEGPAAQPYEKLWAGAQPAVATGGEMGELPQAVEVRRMPLTQARLKGAAPGHRQAVLLGEQVLLFWIDGPTLWLLRMPLG